MKTLQVLIIEDDAVIGMHLSEMLSGLGYEVCGLEDTEAGAIAAAARSRPDLMVVDAGLREGSGVSAVREILRDGFVPHVFISGGNLRDKTLGPGAVTLQKPFHEADLVLAMKRALDYVPAD